MCKWKHVHGHNQTHVHALLFFRNRYHTYEHDVHGCGAAGSRSLVPAQLSSSWGGAPLLLLSKSVHSCTCCHGCWLPFVPDPYLLQRYTPKLLFSFFAATFMCCDAMFMQAGLAVHAALVPAQLSSSWGGAPVLRDHSGADPHIWAR
jgi:hypothetical protein